MNKQPENDFENELEDELEDELESEEKEGEVEFEENLGRNSKEASFNKAKEKEDGDVSLNIKKLEEEVENLKELNLRLKAEFDNFKKRTQKEKILTYDRAKSSCVAQFLEVLDNLERAVELVEKKDKFSQGIDLVVSKFYEVLKKNGVLEIESMGKKFDPNFHEAIKVVEDKNLEKNTICEVFKKGFMLNEMVLRHALVVVANP